MFTDEQLAELKAMIPAVVREGNLVQTTKGNISATFRNFGDAWHPVSLMEIDEDNAIVRKWDWSGIEWLSSTHSIESQKSIGGKL